MIFFLTSCLTQCWGLGVKSLLYFDFSVSGEEAGPNLHPTGCARVRVHADRPDLADVDNPIFVFS